MRGSGIIASALIFTDDQRRAIETHVKPQTAITGSDRSGRRTAFTHSLKKSAATILRQRYIPFYIIDPNEDWVDQTLPQVKNQISLMQNPNIDAAE